MSDLNKVFRENMQITMERMDVSRSELARRLNKSPSYVTQLFTVDRNVGLATVETIAEALGVDPCSLLGQRAVSA